ncbi:EscU/YscU/HrcU family type III secretion system export apparatus switch protein [Oceanobacillus sp. FSL H7-0719]|uniref:EscU/YscU/HrcU family type III secretion system export apparatus switch protein n=1 Tax=Oceanobacillus sp. FSL H7-0719 TaxID=2954507 RepID=UPI00325129AC
MSEKPRKAASLRYNQDKDFAPIVGAAGKGYIADEIIKLAEENNIPIVEDTSLAEILAELNINEYIPEELYQLVAEVFAFIYQTDKKTIKN